MTLKVNNLDFLINSHIGESAVILGSAPTLALVDDHSVQVGIFVGDSMMRTKLRPPIRYYVRANTVYPNLTRKTHVSDLNKLDATWVIAETVMESSIPVRKLLTEISRSDRQSFVFDQRHFGGSSCAVLAECCRVLELNPDINLTIQEILASYSESNKIYSSGSTVSLHALALAVIMGCKEIHVAGVEIPGKASEYIYAPIDRGFAFRVGRIIDESLFSVRKVFSQNNFGEALSLVVSRILSDVTTQPQKETASFFAPDFDQILNDFETIVSLANTNNAKVFVCSHTSNLLDVDGVVKCPLIPC